MRAGAAGAAVRGEAYIYSPHPLLSAEACCIATRAANALISRERASPGLAWAGQRRPPSSATQRASARCYNNSNEMATSHEEDEAPPRPRAAPLTHNVRTLRASARPEVAASAPNELAPENCLSRSRRMEAAAAGRLEPPGASIHPLSRSCLLLLRTVPSEMLQPERCRSNGPPPPGRGRTQRALRGGSGRRQCGHPPQGAPVPRVGRQGGPQAVTGVGWRAAGAWTSTTTLQTADGMKGSTLKVYSLALAKLAPTHRYR